MLLPKQAVCPAGLGSAAGASLTAVISAQAESSLFAVAPAVLDADLRGHDEVLPQLVFVALRLLCSMGQQADPAKQDVP